MPDFIVRAEETDLFFLFKNYEPLVRCKDCKHETDHDCPINWGKTGEDFCSFAERK